VSDNILLIIPARGGSKGIQRKNIRTMSGKPLIFYAIEKARALPLKNVDIYLDSDDDEILFIGSNLGAKVVKRNMELALDQVTLDEVIYHSVNTIEQIENKKYELIVVLQATVPLISVRTIIGALEFLADNPGYDTLIAATRENGFMWRVGERIIEPCFSERVNRQYSNELLLKENGAFTITRREVLLKERTRFTKHMKLFEIPYEEGIDIDTILDWEMVRSILGRRKIVFNVIGNAQVGTGHLHRILTIYDHMTFADKQIVMLKGNDLAKNYFSLLNIEPVEFDHIMELAEYVAKCDLIVNDVLSTSSQYILDLKRKGKSVVNFDDLGPGALFADAVINANFELKWFPSHATHIYWGHKYHCARSQFICSSIKEVTEDVKRVLLLFGGVDKTNLTKKVLGAIYEYCVSNDIEIRVAVGLGYRQSNTLRRYKKAVILESVGNMAAEIYSNDIVFSSLGRTAYEIAMVGVPLIAIVRNEIESYHPFVNLKNGLRILGLEPHVSRVDILRGLTELVQNCGIRRQMNQVLLDKRVELMNGISEVARIIDLVSIRTGL